MNNGYKPLLEFDQYKDEFRIHKLFFNSAVYLGFCETIEYLIARIGTGDDCVSCTFPEGIDGDEELFTGVKCRFLDQEAIVSDKIFYSIMREACAEYIKLYPAKATDINKSLAKLDKYPQGKFCSTPHELKLVE